MTPESIKELRRFARNFNNARDRLHALPKKDLAKWESWPTLKQKEMYDAFVAEAKGKTTKNQKVLLEELKSEITGYKKFMDTWAGQTRYWIVIHLYSIGADILEAIQTVNAVYEEKMTVRQLKAYRDRLTKKGIKQDIKPLFAPPRKKKEKK